MRRLILLRHAKTERETASGEDFERALTERGRADAVTTAKALVAAGLIPDLALVSTAVRARQTFEAAQPFLPDVHLELSRGLYNAPSDTLLRAAEGAEADTVLVIAHNPGIGGLAHDLAARSLCDPAVRDRLDQGFPTGTAAAFEFTDGRIGCLGVFGGRGEGE
jgi:phosphohistidine phosphatase